MSIRSHGRPDRPTASGAVSRLGYRPELDGVRGAAIILVLLVHVHDWPPGGFIGVDVFFTLSGFLIATLLLEEWRARGKISLRHFYARRALRLFRAWYPTIGLGAIGLAAAAVIACVVTDSSPVLRWAFRQRWLCWIGALSYSLYLWHVPGIRLVERSPVGQLTVLKILAGVSLSFVLAVASYRYIEQPFLRRRRKYEHLGATKAEAEAKTDQLRPRTRLLLGRDFTLRARRTK